MTNRIVQEAKKQHINISDFLEKWLEVYVVANRPVGDMYTGYQEFFNSIVPLLEKFKSSIIIGEGEAIITHKDGEQDYEDRVHYNIRLESNGYFYVDWFERRFKKIQKIDLEDLFSPKIILDNLFKTLLTSKKVTDRKMKEILMAKNIVNALSKSLFKD